MSEFSDDDRDLLQQFRVAHDPSADEVHAARLRLHQRLAADDSAAVLPLAQRSASRSVWAFVGVGLAVAAAVALIVYASGRANRLTQEAESSAQEAAFGRSDSEEPSSVVEQPAPEHRRARASESSPDPELEETPADEEVLAPLEAEPETPAAPSRPSVKRRSPPPKRNTDATLSAELALLRPAQKAVRQGNFARGLELLTAHQQAFPRSALGPERALARIEALCGLGKTAKATPEVGRFQKRYPRSHLQGRVDKTCGAP